jgi:hypothetical protein
MRMAMGERVAAAGRLVRRAGQGGARWLHDLVVDNSREWVFVIGLVLVWAGLRTWSPALALVVPGTVLVSVAVFGVRGGGPSPAPVETPSVAAGPPAVGGAAGLVTLAVGVALGLAGLAAVLVIWRFGS